VRSLSVVVIALVCAAAISARAEEEPIGPLREMEDNVKHLLVDSVLTSELADSPSYFDTFPPMPVDSVIIVDTPNDAGGTLNLYWPLSLDDALGSGNVVGYEVLRADTISGPLRVIASLGPGTDRFVDNGASSDREYYYVVRTLGANGKSTNSRVCGPARSTAQWIHGQTVAVLVAILVILLFLVLTRSVVVEEPWIVPAIRSSGDALRQPREGRLVYIPGTGGVDNMATVASLTLLGDVADGMSDKGPGLTVYAAHPLLFVAAEELLCDQGNVEILYVCPDRPTFGLAVTGAVLRDPPETMFLVGNTEDETLLISEVGARVGALQIAGTDAVSQIPFLIATCDLTLIGEELFLAGPQLSAEGHRYQAAPLLHDRLKLLVWLLILLGILAAKLRWGWYVALFMTGAQ
jgi:hypothetical protein